MLISEEEDGTAPRRVIPTDAKVFYRWAINRTAAIIGTQKRALGAPSKGPTRLQQSDEISMFGGEPSRTSDDIEDPTYSLIGQMFSSSIVLLMALLVGILLIVLFGFLFLRKLRQTVDVAAEYDNNACGEMEEGRPQRRRQLQVVLIPKGNNNNNSLQQQQKTLIVRKYSLSSTIRPFRELGERTSNEWRGSTLSMTLPAEQPNSLHMDNIPYMNRKNGSAIPYPKRIYELQTEEGYFSCPPSMRVSCEFD